MGRSTLETVIYLAEYMAGYQHHSGYPVYDGGHSEPESECQHEECKAVRDFKHVCKTEAH